MRCYRQLSRSDLASTIRPPNKFTYVDELVGGEVLLKNIFAVELVLESVKQVAKVVSLKERFSKQPLLRLSTVVPTDSISHFPLSLILRNPSVSTHNQTRQEKI